jgi:hypothetical protein
MTLPDERYNALLRSRDFLRDLLDPKKTPRVPKAVRTQAYYCLKHFPWEMHLEELPKKLPDIFGKRNKSW